MWRHIALWMFVVNLGIAFGAGLYEARVVVPLWADLPPGQWPNTGLSFWVYVTTVPLTLLTTVNAVAGWSTPGPRRTWILAAVSVVVLERVVTFSYFIPTMVRLMGSDGLTDTEVSAALSQWMLMNHGRHLLGLTGWLLALKALSTPSR